MKNNFIDITFDVRTDSNGKDPDSASKTLRYYHKLLWSKTLPSGKVFNLEDTKENIYLYHNSALGEYNLSSDSIIHTYCKWKRTQHIIIQVPSDEINSFYNLGYTVGGFLIFPGNKINGLNTINQERGTNQRINDRIDLTLECIRRYYNEDDSPLFETFKRYSNFFELFVNFKGYCEYFLLEDLVDENFSTIKFFLPFEGFITNPLPNSLNEYNEYKKNNIDFIKKRNERILNYNSTLDIN